MRVVEIDITGYDRADKSRVQYFLDKESFNNPLSTLTHLAGAPSHFTVEKGSYKLVLTGSQNLQFMSYLKNHEYHLTDFGRPEEANYILAFSFGMNPDVNGELAMPIMEAAKNPNKIVIAAQWEIANLLREKSQELYEQLYRIDLDYDKDYITTDEVIQKFIDDVLPEPEAVDNASLLVVAQSWHAPRCIQLCKDRGLKVVAGRFSERFSSSDPQRWVRNAFSWVLKEGTKK